MLCFILTYCKLSTHDTIGLSAVNTKVYIKVIVKLHKNESNAQVDMIYDLVAMFLGSNTTARQDNQGVQSVVSN